MSDFKLLFDPIKLEFDLGFEAPDLVVDGGLETAVLTSLFTDRRASLDDDPPGGPADRRGWWGDGHLAQGDRIGSRLWLFERAKSTDANVALARDYAEEALAWLVADGVARSVDVEAERIRRASGDMLAIQVSITKPDFTTVNFQYEVAWGDL